MAVIEREMAASFTEVQMYMELCHLELIELVAVMIEAQGGTCFIVYLRRFHCSLVWALGMGLIKSYPYRQHTVLADKLGSPNQYSLYMYLESATHVHVH